MATELIRTHQGEGMGSCLPRLKMESTELANFLNRNKTDALIGAIEQGKEKRTLPKSASHIASTSSTTTNARTPGPAPTKKLRTAMNSPNSVDSTPVIPSPISRPLTPVDSGAGARHHEIPILREINIPGMFSKVRLHLSCHSRPSFQARD